MKKQLIAWLVLSLVSLSTLDAKANLEVSASVRIQSKADFDVPLEGHGEWVVVGSYGRCWRPAKVGVEWRPYSSGEWVWTDHGWYWASDEPWAWACYHYGHWAYEPGFGWVWVPGVEWSPAWVSWRVGGGYIGWAPLPPPGLVFKRYPEPAHFVFVGTASFGGRVKASSLIVKDTQVFAQTKETGGVKIENRKLGDSGSQKVAINRGPAPDMLQKASGKQFTAVPIRDAMRRTREPKLTAQVSKSSSFAGDKQKNQDKTSSGQDRENGNSGQHGNDNDHNGASPDKHSGSDFNHGNSGSHRVGGNRGGDDGGGRGRH